MNLKIKLKTFEISKIVEYVDVGNTNLNYVHKKRMTILHCDIFTFLIRRTFNLCRFSLTSFLTSGASECEIFPLTNTPENYHY